MEPFSEQIIFHNLKYISKHINTNRSAFAYYYISFNEALKDVFKLFKEELQKELVIMYDDVLSFMIAEGWNCEGALQKNPPSCTVSLSFFDKIPRELLYTDPNWKIDKIEITAAQHMKVYPTITEERLEQIRGQNK